jgi:hypothetical protein
VSGTITTQGNPVQILVSGDANPQSNGGWGILQLYRSTTAIGGRVNYESSSANENNPYCITCIDNQSAGTYTYSLKVNSLVANTQFGESSGPVLTLVELAGAKGDTGPSGPSASDAAAWTTYNPSWTASVTNPVIGNGTITGRYKQIGKTVFVVVKISMGTSTTYGSGIWRISLPVNAFATYSAILPTTFLDDGINWFQGTSYTEYGGSTSYVTPVLDRGTTGSAAVDFATPFTWGASDALTFSGSYESV